MTFSIDEYLDEKGALEVLCEIDPHGARFDDLAEEIPISRPTVSKRLKQGEEAFLFEQDLERHEGRTTHKWILTQTGAQLRLLLDDNGVTADYRNYKTAWNRFQDRTEWVREFVEANPDKLKPDSYGRGSRGILMNRPDYSTDDEE